MYAVNRLVLFNRYTSQYYTGGSTTGGTVGPRINGATITIRNFYNEVRGTRWQNINARFHSVSIIHCYSALPLSLSPPLLSDAG